MCTIPCHGPRVCFKRQSDGKPISISYVSCGLRTSSNQSFSFTHASPDANNWQVRCFRLEDAGWCDFQEGWSFQTTNRSTVQELQQLVFRLSNCSIVLVREFCVTLVPLGWFLASGNCNCNWAIADGCNGQNWQAAHGKDNMPTQSIRVSVPTGFYDCGRTGTEMTTLIASRLF